jgi:hypothetical protein
MESLQRDSERATSGAPALGGIARDVMDHATIIVRDHLQIGRLEARRYAQHVRRDVAPRAARGAVIVALASVAAACGLVAAFLGIARALDSVAWAFAVYCALFAVAALVALAVAPPRRDEGEEIARRFPAARMKQTEPEHLLVAQRSTMDAHREEVEEARREAPPPR